MLRIFSVIIWLSYETHPTGPVSGPGMFVLHLLFIINLPGALFRKNRVVQSLCVVFVVLQQAKIHIKGLTLTGVTISMLTVRIIPATTGRTLAKIAACSDFPTYVKLDVNISGVNTFLKFMLLVLLRPRVDDKGIGHSTSLLHSYLFGSYLGQH